MNLTKGNPLKFTKKGEIIDVEMEIDGKIVNKEYNTVVMAVGRHSVLDTMNINALNL